MEPPAPLTTWLAEFDSDEGQDNIELVQDLKDNVEGFSHLQLMADGDPWSDDQYLLGWDRENHWLAYFLSRSTQLKSTCVDGQGQRLIGEWKLSNRSDELSNDHRALPFRPRVDNGTGFAH